MEFSSPRFQGDAVLQQILDDPDTGTRKLGPGSPAESVRRLQRALFDLTWTLRTDPPFPDETAFVIGVYGPATTRTVTAYKTYYGIHFPGTATIDGFTGPRTLRSLDAHCVLHDASAAAIEAKAASLRASGTAVVLDQVPPTTQPVLGTPGALRTATVAGEIGLLLHTASLGAFEVHGRIAEAYVEAGHASGPLGFPRTDVWKEDPWSLRSEFEHGFIRFLPDTGEVQVSGPAPVSHDGREETWPATR